MTLKNPLVFGAMRVGKLGRKWAATFPGELPLYFNNYTVMVEWALLGEKLVKTFCVDKRAAHLYFTLPNDTTPTW